MTEAAESAARRGATAPSRLRNVGLERRRNHLDLRHHPSVLMLEDVAVVDELTKIRECDIDLERRRSTVAASPLIDRTDTALVVHHLIQDGRIRRRDSERPIILKNAAAHRRIDGRGEDRVCGSRSLHRTEPGLVNMEVVILGRQLHQFPRLVSWCLATSERQADRVLRRIEAGGRPLRSGNRIAFGVDRICQQNEQ